MRRVLMVCPHGERGGVARVAVALARGLPAHGFEVVTALLARGPLEDELAAAGRPGIVLAARGRRRARQPLRTVHTLARLAREQEAAVVLTQGGVGQLYGAPAAHRARIPAIWWYHGSGRRFLRWRLAASLPAAAVVTVNDSMVEAQRRLTPARRVSMITPGVPVDEIAARRGAGQGVRAAQGWKGLPVVGIVGRLQEWKGHMTFLRAASRIAERHPKARFAVVGEAVPGRRGRAHAAALRRTVDQLGLGDRVHFAGDQRDAYAWLDAFDVAVHASLHEPFGMTLVEAMALGTPLVATDVPGPAGIVEDGVSGLLVPAGDSRVLAAKVTRLLEDRGLAARPRPRSAGAGRRVQRGRDGRSVCGADRRSDLRAEVSGSPGHSGNRLVEHPIAARAVVDLVPGIGRERVGGGLGGRQRVGRRLTGAGSRPRRGQPIAPVRGLLAVLLRSVSWRRRRDASFPVVDGSTGGPTTSREPPGALRLADRVMRPVARRLDADKMARLGIRNTMRLAKRYNAFLYGRHQRSRERLWRDHFIELTVENGGLSNGRRVRLEDGFAIDESGTLPHLEEMLQAGDEVIAERAGTARADDRYRAFFRNMIEVRDLDRWPQFLDFVSSPDLIATVAEYLGFIPALSKTLPTGVRVVESGRHLDSLAHLPPRDSQVFHIDPYDHPMVYVIVLLRDCTPRMGPFTFLPASVSERAAKRLDYWSRGRPYRLSDEEIYSVVDESERVELTYPRGTVLFIDTSRCFHYGSRDADEPRFQAMYGLTSPCRSDFSETYMPQFEYTIRPGDSRLRRLVLDRRALASSGG